MRGHYCIFANNKKEGICQLREREKKEICRVGRQFGMMVKLHVECGARAVLMAATPENDRG